MSDTWLDDVTAALERRIQGAGASPDFLDVVTRAHELDPEAMPAECIEHADALAIAHDLDEPLDEGVAREEAVLDDWLGDVRAAVDRRVHDQQQQPRPALPVLRDRRNAWWIAGMALAAAIVLMLGIGQLVGMIAESSEGDDAKDMAIRVRESSGTTGTAEFSEPKADSPRVIIPPRPRVEHEAIVIPEPMPEPEPEPEPELEPELERATTRPEQPKRGARAQRLKALADEAQAHWRAGRRSEAERLFERIVAEGGRSRAAEMAYADLFTLASQSGDIAAARARWKAYLGRFKRGRFADDASAGLCRSASASTRAGCWAEYLERFPEGSFRTEAQRGGGRP